jgi:hypothetical protein
MPGCVCRIVHQPASISGARDHDNVSIGVSNPTLPVVSVRVEVRILEYLRTEFAGAGDCKIEGLRLDPESNAVPVWPDFLTSQMHVLVIFDVRGMQLQY